MAPHYKILRRLNRHFDDEGVVDLAARAEDFAPGQMLNLGFLVRDDDGPAFRDALATYVDSIPPTIRDGLRGVMYLALTATPPRTVVFALAPAYDFELTIWDMACGITVLYRGRYPGDPPIAAGR
jgi:hypothetical protein